MGFKIGFEKMMREMLKSKIHGATVTGCNLEYTGSITIDESLMAAAGIVQYEKVLVSDMTNGERFETYVIPAKPGSGVVEVNGAAAKLVGVGDRVIVMAFALLDEREVKSHKPKLLVVDNKNRLKRS